ncbi:MAG: Tol-Pal system beta propeller repeat protein TolB, partial [Desulfuromonas sp.]
MKYLHAAVRALLLVIFFVSVVHAADVRFEITKPGEQTIPLAVTQLLPIDAPLAGVAEEFHDALVGDLELTGLFDLVDEAAFLSDAMTLGLRKMDVDFAQWRVLGTDVLVKGGYKVTGEQILFDLRLYDVVTRERLTGKRYSGTKADARRVGHRFADHILFTLTQKKGSFDADIAYISNRSGHKELYLMDVDGHEPRRMTAHSSIVLNPDFSPTRKELIYTSYK